MSDPSVTIVQPKLPRVEFYPAPSGEPYRPCNGSEGEFFHSMWCEECDRDKVMNGTADIDDADRDPSLYCEILNRSFQSDEALPEWVYGDDGQPGCTAFVPKRQAGAPEPVERCPNTIDMFAPALAVPEPRMAAPDGVIAGTTEWTKEGIPLPAPPAEAPKEQQ